MYTIIITIIAIVATMVALVSLYLVRDLAHLPSDMDEIAHTEHRQHDAALHRAQARIEMLESEIHKMRGEAFI